MVGEAHLKDNHTLVHVDEGLGIKGDQNLPLVVYVEKDGRTILQEHSNMKKNGEEFNLLQIVTPEICQWRIPVQWSYN